MDRSGGQPDPNKFVDKPPQMLADPDSVCVDVPQRGPGSLARQTNADIAFYLRLKSTQGCTSRLGPNGEVMHLYIKPNSPAAEFFVQRIRAKLRGLPSASPQKQNLCAQIQKLLPSP